MVNYRRALKNIDPALLEHARKIITEISERHRQDNGPAGHDGESQNELCDEAVDRKKNMGTVLKFLELKGDNQDIRKNLQSMLSEDPRFQQ